MCLGVGSAAAEPAGTKSESRSLSHQVQVLNKFPSISNFCGKPGSNHRVWVLSCDLMMQRGPRPWSEASFPDDKIFSEAISFLLSRRGLVDVLMVFDGCQRKSRRRLASSFEELPHTAEVFLVYQNSWNAWVKKKYFMSSENTECGYISLPVTRTKLCVKERTDGFKGAGEVNSHWTSFTGVEMSSRLGLARISDEDRLKVFSEETDPLPPKWVKAAHAGRPLFWQETKSLNTWCLMLKEVCADCVVDLSPGSGVLAEACMSLGKNYVGLVGHATHLQWITNVIDRVALKYVAKSGSFLYQEDLSTHIKHLFADSVEENIADDEAIQMSDDEGGK